ncbi:ABC transporter ATP-binding protein [Enterococcus sp. ALS3]|uniref:ABC transporter ATP-binding protein n=1 Tax=Enterococcus alishanensis TaxID=1303817 RepID=A0ABS6THZ6_9ENTE|nr:ABC transporter ATP-binding protein [Enterococcus alishanensis]MBV7392415.1 ABC transporter ATP-binding protein [Enterococcus alishanensis]
MTLSIRGLSIKKGQKKILNDVNCVFEEGKLSCILGINGSGKSMFLKSIVGIEKAKGVIDLDMECLKASKLSYISQMIDQLSGITVFEVVLYGLYPNISWKTTNLEITKVESILTELRIQHLINEDFGNLSGGQKQLVILAQALIKNPRLLIADEPTSALDVNNQLRYLEFLKKYIKTNNIIGIVVLHDLSMATRFSDRLYIMEQGKFVDEGSIGEVLKSKVLEKTFGVTLDLIKTSNGLLSIVPINRM